jgi:pimeloyl-ACP methyl ester carboxylesterase
MDFSSAATWAFLGLDISLLLQGSSVGTKAASLLARRLPQKIGAVQTMIKIRQVDLCSGNT